MVEILSQTAPATHLGVRALAQALRAACEERGIDAAIVFDLELAVVEAANNVVEHGYAGRDNGEDALRLTIEWSADEVAAMLEDDGQPAPEDLFALCRTVPLDATEGRGIGIVRSCVDRVDYTRTGTVNRLRLVKALAA